jgi:hypothetical protein
MTGNQRSTFQALTVAVISLGPIVLLGGCREPQAKQSATAPAQSPTALSAATVPGILPVPNTPLLQNAQLPTIPIPGLTPATAPQNLAAQSRNSQADPFANTAPAFLSIPMGKAAAPKAGNIAKTIVGAPHHSTKPGAKTIANSRSGTIANNRSVAINPPQRIASRNVAIPSFPQARFFPEPQAQPQRVISVPQLPPIATAPTVTAVPANAPQVAPIAAPQPQRLAEAIAITGVLQTNGNTMVIAKSPNEQSARYVKAGDSIGPVRVKSIQVSRSGEPTVVLEQNGVEVTKSIGPGR